MSDEPPKDPKDPPADPPQEPTKDLVIDFKDLFDDNDMTQKLEDDPAFKALASELKKVRDALELERKEKEANRKQALLQQLEQGGYDPKEFADLDVIQLEPVVKSLSVVNDRIVVPKKPKEREELEQDTRPQWFNPETNKFEVHSAYLTPEERSKQ